jgi:hypothetical protein
MERNNRFAGKMGNNKMTGIFNPYEKEMCEARDRIKKASKENDYATIRNSLKTLREAYDKTIISYSHFALGLEETLEKIRTGEKDSNALPIIEELLVKVKEEKEGIKESLKKLIIIQNDYEIIDFERKKKIIKSLEDFIASTRN